MVATAPTAVVFRRYKDTLTLVALLPYVRAGYGLCQAYSSQGQAQVVNYAQTLSETLPASPLTQQDVRQLLQVLVSLPERLQLLTVAAESVAVEREPAGPQMNLFLLPGDGSEGQDAPRYVSGHKVPSPGNHAY